jgi:peroxiredoxin
MSKKIQINTTAPDFALNDFQGKTVRLSDYKGTKHVVLIFNRGFT